MHRIVIVGGGAGGLELATRLGDTLGKTRRAHVSLIDRCPTHVWKPLLHEVAAGSLDAHMHQLSYAAQARWHNFEFIQGAMTGVARENRTIGLAPLDDGEVAGTYVLPAREVRYDTLVLALGSQTHFFGIPGARENSIPLDTLEQAEKLRRRLLQASVRSRSLQSSGNEKPIKVAIIGGGATGVELSAELRKMEHELRRFGMHPSGKDNDMSISLLEAGPRLLPALSPQVAERTMRLLTSLNIDVLVGDPVIDVGPAQVRTKSNRTIDADITIWAAGIKAPDLLATLDGLAVNRINQIKVNGNLQSETDANVFAFGDCASCVWAGEKMVPPRAQAAHQQAVYLAKSISTLVAGKPLPSKFEYIDHGSLVSIGSLSAVGSIMGGMFRGSLHIEGLLARVMYAGLYWKHLASLSGFRRMLVGRAFHGVRRSVVPKVKLH